MIVSLYHEIKDLKEPSEIKKRLEEVGLWYIFSPLYNRYHSDWHKILQWIILCFSIHSDIISLDEDFEKTRRRAAEKLGITDDDIILLKVGPQPENHKKKRKKEEEDEPVDEYAGENTVAKVVLEYLQKQGDREFRHLMILRMTYEKMLNSVFEVDWNQQKTNLENADQLYKQIREYEQVISSKLGTQLFEHYKSLTNKLSSSASVSVEASRLILE